MKQVKWPKRILIIPFVFIVSGFLIQSCRKQTEQRLAGLRSEFKTHIFDEQAMVFIRTKLEPWTLFNTGKMPTVTDFYGKPIQYGGLKYNGSVQEAFWSFSDPFLKQMVSSNLQFAVEYAGINEFAKSETLLVARDISAGSIDQVYGEMQRIDRKLRGSAYPGRMLMKSRT
jgi:hypothetical protein